MTEIDERFIIELKGKRYATWPGALDAATTAGLKSLTTHVLQIPTPENGNLAVVEATAHFADGRTFVDVGDASPASTSSQMAAALVRLASTRAKGRVLRDALNIGEALLEEEAPPESDRPTQPRQAYTPPAPPGDRRGPHAQESPQNAPAKDSSGDERASLLQRYQAAQKRARELGLKVRILSVMKASNTEIAEADLELRGRTERKVCVVSTQATVLIVGNTYPVRDQLKALGGRWDAAARGWRVPADVADQARALVPAAPGRCDLPHGELWQECPVRGCDVEPVCCACERCSRHCRCDR